MNSIARYTRIAMLLHWLMAAGVVALFALGWFMVDLPKGPERGYYFALHKSIGLTIFGLLLIRIYWRLRHTPPPLPQHLPRWQSALAHVVHQAFYVALVAQPVSGYLSSSFSGYSTKWFALPLPSWGWRDAPLNEFFTEVHVIVSITLLVLIGVHLLGTLSHLLSGERTMLRRMLPW